MVSAIEVRAYHAFWQPLMATPINGFDTPAFPPQRVRVWECGSWDPQDRVRELVSFDVSPEDAYGPIRVELPRPELIRQGHVCVEFLGKVQRQTYPIADDYFVCINYIKLEGRMLPHIHFQRQADGKHSIRWIGSECCRLCRKSGCRRIDKLQYYTKCIQQMLVKRKRKEPQACSDPTLTRAI
mmetsp:Transcript_12900/g.15569  ORF Transcript_12900/g.15569 Transcript_12900/m.15569 type:complete len:183 (+) Transcript_12900:69-617(+)